MNNQLKIDNLIERIVSGASTSQFEVESRGIELNEVGLRGRTALMVAAAEGLLAAVEALVRSGASIHATGTSRMTALHEAAAGGEVAVANYLLSLGAEVDAQTVDGVTPLMCAAAWGNVDVVKLLLEKRADATRVDHAGATAADIAREKGEGETADLISSYSSTRDA